MVVRNAVRSFARNQSGAVGVEYAIIAFVMAIALIPVVGGVSSATTGLFDTLIAAITLAS